MPIVTVKSNSAEELRYYQSIHDYQDIKEHLELDKDGTEIELEVPPFAPDFSTAIVVDNIPQVGNEKVPKLTQMLLKIYGQVADYLTDADIDMPYNDETNMTHGCCFIKFRNSQDAETAIKVTQDFAIDKKHKFKVSLYSDLAKYAAIPEVYEPQPPPPFQPRPDPTAWLTDPQCRDHFVTRYGFETEIAWANLNGEEPTKIYDGVREKEGGKVWCEGYVQWSPQGTYLATFHKQGIKVWGSNNFVPLGKYIMPNVEIADFSPCENYLVTYRYDEKEIGTNAKSIVIWDVLGQREIRHFGLKNDRDVKFQVEATVYEEKTTKKAGAIEKKYEEKVIRGRVEEIRPGGHSSPPIYLIKDSNAPHVEKPVEVPADKVIPLQNPNILKWSYDGKYLARLGPDIISVYSMPSAALLDSKSIAAKDVLDFVWSPYSNMISYWSPAVGNHPALISIIQIPSRNELCSRKLFDVSDGRMAWQNEGDYLCVYMSKVQGKKKTHVLMFFRVREPGVPVEQIELTDAVLSVSWEPSGDRVVIVHGETRSPTISFYSMSGLSAKKENKGKKELVHLYTLNGVQCNEVIWSPAGGVIALAYFASDACIFELHDVENQVKLATRRHDRCNRLFWDPSGRVVASCTITPLRNANVRGNVDDGFNFYTFQGTPLVQIKREKLFQFQWRPRPKDLLTPEEKKKVVKNLRKYEKMFDKEDRVRKQELYQEVVAARRKMADDFLAIVNRNKAIQIPLKRKRVELRNGYDSDDDRNYIIENIVEETVVSTKEQIMS